MIENKDIKYTHDKKTGELIVEGKTKWTGPFEYYFKDDIKKLYKIKEYIKNRKEEIWNFYGTLNEIKGRDLIEFQTLSQIENIIKE